MAGKAWQQELVVSEHISSVSGSREMNTGSNHSLPFIQSGTPDNGIVPHSGLTQSRCFFRHAQRFVSCVRS